jgi:hypothetical protein
MTSNENLVELTTSGEGFVAPIDPRMDREPAGSLLLARAGAIRTATQNALREVMLPKIKAINPALEEVFERDFIPRSLELVYHRLVIDETRTDPSDKGATYTVQLQVVFDMNVINAELDRLRR